ncbi:hypothetical protein T492DRAFT_1021089 [Pavlovales sp. CCMP2436]|nr:hypothetical protein T492DRAFT_1021089 [Pavlovales sp. CCMP2436]
MSPKRLDPSILARVDVAMASVCSIVPNVVMPSTIVAPLLPVLRERAAATVHPEGGAAWLATMMLLFANMLLLLSRAVTDAVSRGGEQHAETPLKATKATTTMLLPAATAVCALAAARCCPLEVLAGTSRPPFSLGSSSVCASRAAVGAAARGSWPHAETPLKATKATTMLLPAAAAVLPRLRRCCFLRPPQCARSQRRDAVYLRYSLAPLDHPSRSGPQVDVCSALAVGAAARGGGPHTETPLQATKATTMLLPAAATAGLRRPRRGRGGAWGPGRTHSHPLV